MPLTHCSVYVQKSNAAFWLNLPLWQKKTRLQLNFYCPKEIVVDRDADLVLLMWWMDGDVNSWKNKIWQCTCLVWICPLAAHHMFYLKETKLKVNLEEVKTVLIHFYEDNCLVVLSLWILKKWGLAWELRCFTLTQKVSDWQSRQTTDGSYCNLFLI